MSIALLPTLLACTLLETPVSVTVPVAPCGTGAERPILLEAEPCAPSPQVRIGEGVATVLLFDSSLEGVEVPSVPHFQRVVVAQGVLMLLPGESLEGFEGGPLKVRFADDAAPASAALQLVVVPPARAERQVEVFRRARPAASFERELREVRAENERLQEENARLRAARTRPEGLLGLWAEGWMNKTGVLARSITLAARQPAKNSLTIAAVYSFRANGGLMVAVELKNPGTLPWQVEGAALVGQGGDALRVEQVWQAAPMGPGRREHVLVSLEAVPELPPGPFTLTLWAPGSQRAVTVRDITFP
jgi:uncharacterized protein (TIGR02268 family)